jgi:hypothetical protein
MVITLVAGAALAQRGRTVQKINLTPTSQGKVVDLTARATKGTSGGTQFFAVQAVVNPDAMKDGSEMEVLIDTFSGRVDLHVGQITLLNGYGELRLIRGPFGGTLTYSLADIKTVRLVDVDGILAEGSF